MCWSVATSVTSAGAGIATTIYLFKKKEKSSVWLTVFYFSLMEILQAISYIWVGECGLQANKLLTELSYIHISFQMPVINYFAFNFVSNKVRRSWEGIIIKLSFVASFLMLSKLIIPKIVTVAPEYICSNIGYGMCGVDTCTYLGNWHLAWDLRLLGGDPYNLLYGIPVFIFPLLYGNWRFAFYLAITGPLLTRFLTNKPNESPAIWCLFAVALIMLGLFTPLRKLLKRPAT